MEREHKLWEIRSGEWLGNMGLSEQGDEGGYGCKHQVWGPYFGASVTVRDGLCDGTGIKMRTQEETGVKSLRREAVGLKTQKRRSEGNLSSVHWDGVCDSWVCSWMLLVLSGEKTQDHCTSGCSL